MNFILKKGLRTGIIDDTEMQQQPTLQPNTP